MKKILLSIIYIIFISAGLAAIEIIAKDNNTLSLKTDILLKSIFDLNDLYWAFLPPEVEFELEGDSEKKLGFDVDLKLKEIYTSDYEKIIDNCYVWMMLCPEIKLALGQFKAPFGEEILLGKMKRPYPFHSLGSNQIAPGLDRGGAVSVNNLFAMLDIDFGVFNGAGSGAEPADFNSILCTGKGSLKFNPGDSLEIKAGYSLLYKLEDVEIILHTIGQGIFGRIEWKIDTENKLSLFSEYLEKRSISGAINDQEGWEFSLFNALSFSSGIFELFATFEIYKPNSMFNLPEDEWKVAGGVNLYPFTNLRVSLVYEGKNWWNEDTYEHKITVLTLYQF